ncbi:MAG: hypothetical protein WBE44_15815 [Terriglobales bacterium]
MRNKKGIDTRTIVGTVIHYDVDLPQAQPKGLSPANSACSDNNDQTTTSFTPQRGLHHTDNLSQ